MWPAGLAGSCWPSVGWCLRRRVCLGGRPATCAPSRPPQGAFPFPPPPPPHHHPLSPFLPCTTNTPSLPSRRLPFCSSCASCTHGGLPNRHMTAAFLGFHLMVTIPSRIQSPRQHGATAHAHRGFRGLPHALPASQQLLMKLSQAMVSANACGTTPVSVLLCTPKNSNWPAWLEKLGVRGNKAKQSKHMGGGAVAARSQGGKRRRRSQTRRNWGHQRSVVRRTLRRAGARTRNRWCR